MVWFGFLVMRLAMVSQWLRAAYGSTGAERRTALSYALGVTVCQVGWLGLLIVPSGDVVWVFVVVGALELAVPAVAERTWQTAWHPHHIAERYGLFLIIVLGETISAATVAVQSALDENDELGVLLPLAGGGLLLVFAAYWIYFAVPIHLHLRSNRQAFLWGYGHYLVYASAAAVGAGIEIAVEESVGSAHLSLRAASACATVPAALFMFTVWLIHSRHQKRGLAQQLVLPVSSVAVLACTFAGELAVLAAGLVAAVTVAVGATLTARQGTALEG